jgi:hypothetical protein
LISLKFEIQIFSIYLATACMKAFYQEKTKRMTQPIWVLLCFKKEM